MQDTAVLGGGGIAVQVSFVRGAVGMAEQDSAVLGGAGIAVQVSAVRGAVGMADPDTEVLGGAGIAVQVSAVRGAVGMAEQDTEVLGGGGMAERSRSVLGGGGITGPGRVTSISPMLRLPGGSVTAAAEEFSRCLLKDQFCPNDPWFPRTRPLSIAVG
ncbi:MAG TPA: hypothetical protein VIY52_00080 [Streptosporangiaceae bacterium]